MNASVPNLEDIVRSLEQRNAALTSENERMLLEKYQAQAVLDRLVAQRAGEAYLSQFWTRTPPVQWTIDLRRRFDGSNWYPAEHDGCWAGPATTSTLRLPALPPFVYDLALDIVDAMDPAIVPNLRLALNGHPIEPVVVHEGYAAPAVTRFNAADIPPSTIWELQLGFPSVVSPAEHGSEDRRKLAIRLRSVTLTIRD
ncbi:MAG TPA: hypothetical protein VN782_07160 [Usitatibacter sp.]|nr:hypothetical protein [Usitatibacter sp.]